MENFYVYVYLDPRKKGKYQYGDLSFSHEPFYIGRGSNHRVYDHLYPSRLKISHTYKSNKIAKLLSLGYDLKKYIFKIYENLSEQQSKFLEIEAIRQIGRFDTGTGPLTNATIGGDGAVGFKHTNIKPQSKKTRKKRSNSMLGNQNGKNLKGYKQTEEHFKKIAKIRRMLTYEQAQEIRSKYKFRVYTCKMLAKEFGVTRESIKEIIAGRTYKYSV